MAMTCFTKIPVKIFPSGPTRKPPKATTNEGDPSTMSASMLVSVLTCFPSRASIPLSNSKLGIGTTSKVARAGSSAKYCNGAQSSLFSTLFLLERVQHTFFYGCTNECLYMFTLNYYFLMFIPYKLWAMASNTTKSNNLLQAERLFRQLRAWERNNLVKG